MIVAMSSKFVHGYTVVPNIHEVLRRFNKTRAKGENANVKAICKLCISFSSYSSAAREESDTAPNLKVLKSKLDC